MKPRHNFEKLSVWIRSRELVVRIYETTKAFPSEELFGLTGQLRKSCISIPSNIAEGCGRRSDAELVRFCSISLGSAFELETQLFISEDLGFISATDANALRQDVIEIQRMIDGFMRSLKE